MKLYFLQINELSFVPSMLDNVVVRVSSPVTLLSILVVGIYGGYLEKLISSNVPNTETYYLLSTI